MLTVYHYTSEDSLRRIRSSGYIQESTLSNTDAFYGRGVYLTTLSPAEGRRKISDNNWGLSGPYREDQGKVDCAIELWIPKSRLKRARAGNRDIWVHQGDIVLGNYQHQFLYALDDDQGLEEDDDQELEEDYGQGLQDDDQELEEDYGQGLQDYSQGLQDYGQGLQDYSQGLQDYGQGLQDYGQGLEEDYGQGLQDDDQGLEEDDDQGLEEDDDQELEEDYGQGLQDYDQGLEEDDDQRQEESGCSIL